MRGLSLPATGHTPLLLMVSVCVCVHESKNACVPFVCMRVLSPSGWRILSLKMADSGLSATLLVNLGPCHHNRICRRVTVSSLMMMMMILCGHNKTLTPFTLCWLLLKLQASFACKKTTLVFTARKVSHPSSTEHCRYAPLAKMKFYRQCIGCTLSKNI